MLLRCFVLVAGAACGWGESLAGIEIRNFHYDPATHSAEYDLVNTTSKRATFIELRPVEEIANGERDLGRMSFLTSAEGFNPSIPGPRRASEPGGMQHESSSLFAREGTPAIRVSAVIFEDGTASGDPKSIEQIFGQRRARAAEYKKWLVRLEALQKSPALYSDARSLYDALIAANAEADWARFDLPDGNESETNELAAIRQEAQTIARIAGRDAQAGGATPMREANRLIKLFSDRAEGYSRAAVRR